MAVNATERIAVLRDLASEIITEIELLSTPNPNLIRLRADLINSDRLHVRLLQRSALNLFFIRTPASEVSLLFSKIIFHKRKRLRVSSPRSSLVIITPPDMPAYGARERTS